MNILLVSADNSKYVNIGGKHIHQELLERGWKESGHSVMVIYPRVKKFPIIQKIKNRTQGLLGIRKSQIYIKHVNRFISDMENQFLDLHHSGIVFDIISSQDPISGVTFGRLLEKLNLNIPIINTLHGYLSLETLNYGYFSENDKQNVLNFTKSLEKESAGYSRAIVTVDSRIKNYVIDELKYKNKIYVIYNAIDNKRFMPVNIQEQSILKEKFGFEKNDILVLIARRMVKKNGIIFGLEAAEKLLHEYNREDIKFCIAGHGKEKRNLIQFVKKYHLENQVKFVGSIAHQLVDQYYKMADFILMPSTKSDDVEEATSLSMLEGLVCGKVVIATAIGGMKEVINSGENGLLVNDRDSEKMAELIDCYSRDLDKYNKISIEAHSYAMGNHGYLYHSEYFISIFEEENKKGN